MAYEKTQLRQNRRDAEPPLPTVPRTTFVDGILHDVAPVVLTAAASAVVEAGDVGVFEFSRHLSFAPAPREDEEPVWIRVSVHPGGKPVPEG